MRAAALLSLSSLLLFPITQAGVVMLDENGSIFSQVQAPESLELNSTESASFSQPSLVGFSINVTFTGTPPPASQQQAFTDAANAWMSRITGYRGTMFIPSIDIEANISFIDGVGQVLGSAGPTRVMTQDEDGQPGGDRYALVTDGSMNFDSADIDNLESNGLLDNVIEHEMGHVLGIGTLWNTVALGYPGTQSHYDDGTGQYTGPNALSYWQTEFGQTADTFVPVELGGGPGTADSHWNEVDGGASATGITQVGTGNDLQNELMTGWLSGAPYVSQMTLGSLEDIGYTVIPEASTCVLLILGSLVGWRRRR